MKELYQNEYYLKHLQGSYQSAMIILNYISSFFIPSSAIDFGCGIGAWLKAAKEIYQCEILGIDQHEFSPATAVIRATEYITYDLRKQIQLEKRYDIALSLEVAEHIESEYSSMFISNLCGHSDIILFSAALPKQGGTNHVNEQPCSYWMNLFAQNNFVPLDCIRPYVWDNEKVEVWYRNNTLLYIEKDKYDFIASKIIKNPFPIDIIHPEMLERILRKRGG